MFCSMFLFQLAVSSASEYQPSEDEAEDAEDEEPSGK